MSVATANKNSRTLKASGSVSAGGTSTSTEIDLSQAIGGMLLVAKITNGGTGPTVGCDFIVEVSHDGAAWTEFTTLTADTVNSSENPFTVLVPPEVMNVRVVFEGNTGQAVTVECYGQEYTSVTAA